MITQTIKRWLHQLRAWWHRNAEPNYTRPVSNLNKGAMPDALSRTVVDGVVPQPSSVAVDHERNESTQTLTRSDHVEPATQEDKAAIVPAPVSIETEGNTPPLAEQRLEFFRYLVEHGFVNEGFKKEEAPKQYRRCGYTKGL